jgi:hypothetical protein
MHSFFFPLVYNKQKIQINDMNIIKKNRRKVLQGDESHVPVVKSVCHNFKWKDCRGRDRMVVGFTTTCLISAYHH